MNDYSEAAAKTKNKPILLNKLFYKFLLPSLLGVFLFMVPVPVGTEEGLTVPIAFISGLIRSLLGEAIPTIAVLIIILSAIGSIVTVFLKPKVIIEHSFLNNLLNVSKLWLTIRIVAAIIGVMTLYELGPEWIYSENTGGLLLFDLVPILFATFLLAGFLLPLLLDFGLLEFFGALLMKVMRPVFTLPGRSSLDCLASWVGDGTIGVMLTIKQYEEGFYTKREAAVIATTFSVVSITFSIAILSYMDLAQYFGIYYLTILLAGFVAAIIMPRIPPLSRKADTGYEHVEFKKESPIPTGFSSVQWGLKKALERSDANKGFIPTVKSGVKNVLDMWVGVLPAVMAIGGIAVMIAEYTPLFTILGKPFEPILTFLQVPEAGEAAKTMVVGFADMFLPAVIGSGIESEMTRFVIACVSVTQLVYMSELGGLLLGSKLPLKMTDLILIFLLRTFITLPIIVFVAHIIF